MTDDFYLLSIQIYRSQTVLQKALDNFESIQLDFRRSASSWLASIMVAVIYLLTAHPEDLHLPGTMGISLVCWAGIFGLIPIYLADIRHLELIRRSLQFELSSIEASNRWLPQTVTDTKIGSLQEVGPLASSVARFYLFFFGILTIISAAVALDHFSEQPAWWLVLHLGLHIGAILSMALISKRLLEPIPLTDLSKI